MQAITSGDVALRAAAGGFALHVTRHAAGTILRRHDHEAASLQVVLGGEFTEVTGRRTHACSAGTMIFKPGGAHHADEYTSAVQALLIEVPAGAAPGTELLLRRDPAAVAIARRIAGGLTARPAGWELDVEEDVMALLARVEAPPRHRRSPRPSWVDDAVDLARDGASLAQVSACAGRHRTHVARVLRETLGVPIGAFVRTERLHASALWLRASSRPIAQVAVQCGFFDQSHFTRAFRALFGIAPSQYRRQAQTLHGRPS
jgi:AraC family transcriptional regulator